MAWHEIESQADADALMKVFGGFHDACIREAHLWTEHWVSPELSMSCPCHLDNSIRFLIQRQFKDVAAVELLFERVTRFNLVPSPENYESIIFGASLLVEEGMVYWSPEGSWRPDSEDKDNFTWVSAKELRWREVDWLGKKLRYGPGDLP